MADNVYIRVTNGGQTVYIRSGIVVQAASVVLPNFPGHGDVPASSYLDALSAVIDRLPSLATLAAVNSAAAMLSAQGETIVAIQGQYDTLQSDFDTLQANPLGLDSLAFDSQNRLVMTLESGQTLQSGPLALPLGVVVSQTEPTGPYGLWIKVDADGNALSFNIQAVSP